MSCMHERGFWMTDMSVLGSNRIRKDLVNVLTRFERNYMLHLLKKSPGWAEVAYMNSLFWKRLWQAGIPAGMGMRFGQTAKRVRFGVGCRRKGWFRRPPI